MLLLMSYALAGCASREPVGSEFCIVSLPIFIGERDVLTDKTARQILTHNELGVRLCDWPNGND